MHLPDANACGIPWNQMLLFIHSCPEWKFPSSFIKIFELWINILLLVGNQKKCGSVRCAVSGQPYRSGILHNCAECIFLKKNVALVFRTHYCKALFAVTLSLGRMGYAIKPTACMRQNCSHFSLCRCTRAFVSHLRPWMTSDGNCLASDDVFVQRMHNNLPPWSERCRYVLLVFENLLIAEKVHRNSFSVLKRERY